MPLSARQFEVESQMLIRYRAAEISALQMLAAAHDADWDGVARCEARFRSLAQRPPIGSTDGDGATSQASLPQAQPSMGQGPKDKRSSEHLSSDRLSHDRLSPDRLSSDRLSPDPLSLVAHRERLRAIRRLILIDAEVRRACDPRAARLDAMLSV